MGYLKDSLFYYDAIQEIRHSCATYYLFDTFIVSEIDEGVDYTWDDHARQIVEEISELYDQKGEDLILLSNRVHSYSIKPSDWIKFFRNDYKLKGYGIINYTKKGFITSLVEKLFVRHTFRNFDNLTDAIDWAKNFDIVEKKIQTDKIA